MRGRGLPSRERGMGMVPRRRVVLVMARGLALLEVGAQPAHAAGHFAEFPIPTLSSTPQGITSGPDGNLWFTELGGLKIGRITTRAAITEFAISPLLTEPWAIAAGPDGNIWFTEEVGKVGAIQLSGA